MTKPAKSNISLYQGQDFEQNIVWKSGDPLNPVDLTGYTARMQIRPKAGSSTLYIELTTENGGITLGGTTGNIYLYISALDTSSITWKSAVYDLEMISSTLKVRRLLQGNVSVSLEVTK